MDSRQLMRENYQGSRQLARAVTKLSSSSLKKTLFLESKYCLIIIQQIVTMPIYGKEALNICHPT